ncbi:MAG: glycosyltransferase family 4 protein [Bacteroidetes bacterium]|nr:glycosyltransferase family 4 protein [Bacteroidota bacterium]
MICFVCRKREDIYFSIEKIFDGVAAIVARQMEVTKAYAPYSQLSPKNIRANIRYVRRLRADIFHLTGGAEYLAMGLPGNTTVLTIHDCVFMYQSSGIKRKILQWLFLKVPVRRCRAVTAISEATKADIIRFTGCRPEKITVIPNPVSDAIVYREKIFNAHKPVLLFIGSTPNKNLHRVIETLKGIPCRLDIVGIILPEHEEQLRAYGIDYQRYWQLSEEGLAERYTESDIVVFPSTFEGFGLPIIEAQKAGRPVLTSRISPLQEVAGDGACLVDPYDVKSIRTALIRLIEEPAYREAVVRTGFENVRQYTKEAVAQKYIDLYKTI